MHSIFPPLYLPIICRQSHDVESKFQRLASMCPTRCPSGQLHLAGFHDSPHSTPLHGAVGTRLCICFAKRCMVGSMGEFRQLLCTVQCLVSRAVYLLVAIHAWGFVIAVRDEQAVQYLSQHSQRALEEN